MLKKIIIFLSINGAFLLANTKLVFASDLFVELEKIEINQEIPEYIKSQGVEINDNNHETTYLKFESDSKSFPHFIETTLTNKALYIELKIPKEYLDQYKEIMKNLGEPESKNSATPDGLYLASYPSKGIGFILDPSQKIISVTKYPLKTTEVLLESEGKNFKEKSQLYTTEEKELFKPNPTLEPIPKDVLLEVNYNKTRNQKNILTSAAIVLSILLLIWAVMGVRLYLKNKKQKQQEKQSLVNFSDTISLPNKKDQV